MKTYPKLSCAGLTIIAFTVAFGAAVGCGGPKTGVKGGDVPPPPRIEKSEIAEPAKPEPKRDLTKDTKRDYESAGCERVMLQHLLHADLEPVRLIGLLGQELV